MKTLYIGKNKNEVQWSVENTEISVVYSNNGLEAINILKTQKDIGAIICEYNLSGNNGLFLHQQLKEEYNLSSIPFVLLLEEHSPKIYNEAFKAGVNDYFVMKSTSIEQIFLRTRQLAQQNKETAVTHSTSKPATYKFPISKRIFDITIASFILLMLSPLLLIIIIAIRLESKGKVYYIAKRVGRKTFDFYKLRSMHNGSDKLLKQLAKEKISTVKLQILLKPKHHLVLDVMHCQKVNFVHQLNTQKKTKFVITGIWNSKSKTNLITLALLK